MRRILPPSLASAAIAAFSVGALITSAQAFPFGGDFIKDQWRKTFSGYHYGFGLGVIDAGECILIRRDVIDGFNRVHVRLLKLCD